MNKLRPILSLVIVLGLLWFWQQGAPATPAPSPTGPASTTEAPPQVGPPVPDAALPDFLPPEAADTMALIARGGPFPHRQDGGVFGNREHRLPSKPRGHYREYTVAMPGLGHRGPRRIVTGGNPPSDYWYTGDHYESFRQFEPQP